MCRLKWSPRQQQIHRGYGIYSLLAFNLKMDLCFKSIKSSKIETYIFFFLSFGFKNDNVGSLWHAQQVNWLRQKADIGCRLACIECWRPTVIITIYSTDSFSPWFRLARSCCKIPCIKHLSSFLASMHRQSLPVSFGDHFAVLRKYIAMWTNYDLFSINYNVWCCWLIMQFG